ncbi:unnamed protein product, partial [Cladocopium goreaui]
EHKLQDINVAELEPKVLQIFNRACFGEHRAAWAVSTARKGYSGVCAIFRDSAGGGVSNTTAGEIDQVDAAEGRSVRLDLECGLIVIGMYVPNSGQKLARLDYRVNVWDMKLRSYLRDLDRKAGRRGGLVICGDFNVAHQDIDIWNPEAHQIKRQAGTTAPERESFANLLKELDLVDAFRHGNPEAREVYTYWSSRILAEHLESLFCLFGEGVSEALPGRTSLHGTINRSMVACLSHWTLPLLCCIG